MRKTVNILCLLLALTAIATNGIAATTAISVSATILSKSICRFDTKTANLAFGTLDPLAAPDVTVTASLNFVCNGSANPATYAITDNDGLHETGIDANRMRHATVLTQYLPYSFSMAPAAGSVPKGVAQTLTVTGTVLGTDYRTALTGNYADTITLTINP